MDTVCTITVRDPRKNMALALFSYRGLYGWQVESEHLFYFQMGRPKTHCETPQELERFCEELRRVLDQDTRIDSFYFQSRDTLEELT